MCNKGFLRVWMGTVSCLVIPGYHITVRVFMDQYRVFRTTPERLSDPGEQDRLSVPKEFQRIAQWK
ncbi:hypothetical protein HOY82DRAFT_561369 [Tuber indicum]|nr:hypothetical protein HOY82DRAFT_561369 [Tuber indicum]